MSLCGALARRPALATAAVFACFGAAALVYGITLPVPHPAAHPTPAQVAAGPAASRPTSPTRTAPRMTPRGTDLASAGAASQAPSVDGGVSSASLQRALSASSPPDLASAAANRLIAIARSELRTDLVAGGTAAGLEIQAAIARRHDGRADLADVTMLYTDQDPASLEPEHLAVLTYALTSRGWVPVIGQNGLSES
jgi:hypothetical protein